MGLAAVGRTTKGSVLSVGNETGEGRSTVSFKEWESARTPSGLGTGRRLGFRLAGVCAAAMLVAACSNKVVDLPEPGGQNTLPNGEDPSSIPGTGNGGGGGNAEECAPGRFARKAIWLSDVQFANAITSLLGPGALPADQAPDASLKPFSQKGVVVNTSMLRTRLDAAEAAASSLTGEVGTLSGCAATDDACAQAYIADLAHRAFRRPVAQAELTDLNAVYAVGRETSLEVGIQLATQAIIASPSFSYRTEFGDTVVDAATGTRKLGGVELASLLSFWLTDAPPDDALLTAAESGALDQPGEVQRQVERMLSSDEARDSITLTLMSAWGMSNIFGNAKDPNAFPEYGPLLQSNMFEETRLFLNNALWSGGSTVDQVLTSRRSFVNQSLADLYDVPFTGSDPTEFVPIDLPEGQRAGLLTQPSLLAARARTTDTSVVARGLFVRASLLCLDRPPPPPEDVIAQVQELLAADLTERERADFRAMTSPCKNCHSSIDGFGLMLENYDAIGRYRTELDGEPIDATVDLGPLGYEGTYSGVVDFVSAAAEDPQFTACMARHLAVYATGEDIVKTRDCELEGFANAVPSEMTLSEIVASLAESPLLTTRSGE